MPKWHINNNNEMGICRARPGNCDFGGKDGSENHYEDPMEAMREVERRNEETHDAHTTLKKPKADQSTDESLNVLRTKLKEDQKSPTRRSHLQAVADIPAETPTTNENFHDKFPYLKKPYVMDPKKSKVIAKPKQDNNTTFIGGKVNGYIDSKELVSKVRDSLHEALKAGELPRDLKYTVRQNSDKSGTEIVVSNKDGSPLADSWVAREPDYYRARTEYDDVDYSAIRHSDKFGGDPLVLSDQAQQVKEYLSALGNQYGSQRMGMDDFTSYGTTRVILKRDPKLDIFNDQG